MTLCWEHWTDELGCDSPGPHHCVRGESIHTRHICRCGAQMWDWDNA